MIEVEKRDGSIVVFDSSKIFSAISKAFDSLDGRADITREEMAQLEFQFVNVLDDSEHGIPNLESQIIKSPDLFFQIVAHIDARHRGRVAGHLGELVGVEIATAVHQVTDAQRG